MSDRKNPRDLTTLIAAAAAVFFFAFFCWSLKSRHWSDSEVWGVRQASACLEYWSNYACSSKPLFHLLVGSFENLFADRGLESTMFTARSLLVPIWGLVIYIWWMSRSNSVLLVCFLSSSCFLLDANVARSDFFSLPFVLLHAWLLRADKLNRSRAIGIILSAAAALALTPKSIFFLLCFAPLYLSQLTPAGLWFHTLANVKKALLIAAGILLCFVSIPLLDLHHSGQYFLSLFTAKDYGFSYFDLKRFTFLTRAAKENPHIVALLLIWLLSTATGIVRRRRISPASICSFMLFTLVVGYPDKLPFFISYSLLLVLFISAEDIKNSAAFAWIKWPLLLFACLNGIHWINQSRDWNNDDQIKLVSAVDTLLADSPLARPYDGIGAVRSWLLPNEFIGPGSELETKDHVRRLISQTYDVILVSKKVSVIRQELEAQFGREYLESQPDIFVRTIDLVVKNPQQPQAEIATALAKSFPTGFHPKASIAVFVEDRESDQWRFIGSRTYSFSELESLPPLCSKCETVRVTATPFGRFFTSNALPLASEQLAFEPKKPRQTLIESLATLTR